MSKKRRKGFTSRSNQAHSTDVGSQKDKTVAVTEPQPIKTARRPQEQIFFSKLAIPLIILTGILIFASSLKNPFVYDDFGQIVNNPVVHSLSHLGSLFRGSTQYNGGGYGPLSGIYYRPLVSTLYALIYTFFGAQSFYFHLVQLSLAIGSTILVFRVFRYSFGPALSLLLSLIFLVHPVDSQAVFGIDAMADSLFFFFGILAIWLLLRFSSVRNLWFVAASLTICLFANETGFLFLIMSLLYLFWFNRERFAPLAYIMSTPTVVYFVLRFSAVGLTPRASIAPIDKLSLVGRLMTMPSIIQFYITKFIFPLKLATGYYWTFPNFTISHVFIPLIVGALVIGGVVYLGKQIHRTAKRPMYLTFWFFTIWAGLGLLAQLQFVPLDATVNNAWFYYPMFGVLGMIGITVVTFPIRLRPQLVTALSIVLIFVLSALTFIRGNDWRSQEALSKSDLAASHEDYVAADSLATELLTQNNLAEAKYYALLSVRIYPEASNYITLGTIDAQAGNYSSAQSDFDEGLKFPKNYILADDISRLTMFTGDPNDNVQTLRLMNKNFPKAANPYLYLALIEYTKLKDPSTARSAIQTAARLGQSELINQAYASIMNNEPLPSDLVAKQ